MIRYDDLVGELRKMLPEYMAQRGQVVGVSGRRKIRCINPLHQDRTPSMSYHIKTEKLHCFGCGKSYDLFDVIKMDYPDCNTFPRQVRKACDLFGFVFPEDFGHQNKALEEPYLPQLYEVQDIGMESYGKNLIDTGEMDSQKIMVQSSSLLVESKGSIQIENFKSNEAILGENKLYSGSSEDFHSGNREQTSFVEHSISTFGLGGAYFEKRGISQDLCKKYRLFQDETRAYLPLFVEGVCLAYSARALSDALEPRYKNSPGAIRFFGEDWLLNGRGNGTEGSATLVVTESVFDALSAEECGFPAIALNGAGNVQRFLTLCAQNPGVVSTYRFLAAGDGDKAGQRMNGALCQGLEALGLSCARVVLPEGVNDLNEALLRDREELRTALETAADRDAQAYSRQCAGNLLEDLLDETKLEGLRYPLKTGFARLDGLLDGGLYTGLYVMGAISSLGKTSLFLQIADFIAENGSDVLYFSLEMSQKELVAKSLSRISRCLDPTAEKGDSFTAREVLRMGTEELLLRRKALLFRAAQAYGAGAGTHIFFSEGVSSMDSAEICERVHKHIRLRKTRPVVLLDYLQILKPGDNRATDKQNTDRAIVELKRLSRDCDLPVLIISSFNRENYKNAVSMEAFKESGAVEYSSDVLLGLQYVGMGERDFDLNKARAKAVRDVELVVLKNRNGVAYGRIPFRYDAKHSYFVEKN